MAEGMLVFWTLWETYPWRDAKNNNSKSLSTTGSEGAVTSSRPSYEYKTVSVMALEEMDWVWMLIYTL